MNSKLATFPFTMLLLVVGSSQGAEAFQTASIPAQKAAPAVPLAEEVYGKGLAFLLAHQNPDGSWGSFESARPYEVWLGTTASHHAFGDGTSALCVMALQSPARDNAEVAAALEKGARYLLKQKPVLRATGQALYSVWTQIYVLEALAGVLREPRLKALHSDAKKNAKKQIEVLAKIQGSEGGFGYYDFDFAAASPTGSESTSFTTAAALLALEHIKEAGVSVPEQMTRDAVQCVQRLRIGDGAYIYGTYAQNGPQRLYNRVNGSLGRSQVCNLALYRYHAGVTQTDMRNGLENLFKNHHFIEMGKGRPIPHESWYSTAGYYFFFGHYYGAHVAREIPPEEGVKYLRQLEAVMCRLQDPDGSWWDFPLYGYHKAYGTAFALLTLELARR